MALRRPPEWITISGTLAINQQGKLIPNLLLQQLVLFPISAHAPTTIVGQTGHGLLIRVAKKYWVLTYVGPFGTKY